MIGLTTTSFAQTEDEIEVLQGTTKPFFNIFSHTVAPQLIQGENDGPAEGNIVDLTYNGNNFYTLEYTPDPEFLGYDNFKFETYVVFDASNPANSVKKTVVVLLDVVASMIASNDDFVHLTSQDETIIDPLSNDESSSEDLTVTLAHVLRGTAVVNGDQTISYTPVDDEPDYIIYTVNDELNTISSSTIYLSQEEAAPEESTVKEFVIASGNSQYIILPNEDFALNDEEYDNGSVEQVNSFVYKYTANTNLEGSDNVHFTDSNNNEYHASISIIEKFTDEGIVKDDLFYSASNTNTVFDVTLNDVNDNYVISDYSDSEELIHLGSGLFSYTPEPSFVGVKTFFYTVDDGFAEESGTIELVINNFKPINYFDYNLSTPQNQPRIIEYDVPLGTEYYEIASFPDHGSVEIYTEEESVDLGCDEGIQKVFAVYTPDTDYVGVDDMTIKYCASDNNLCTEVNISFEVIANELEDCICVDDCVWPGDANGDGKVSVVDVLSIGRFIGNGGTARDESPFGVTYEGSKSENWTQQQVNGKNLKHVDADGDGIITEQDLDVVIDNYGSINSIISNDVLGVKSVPFFLTTENTDVEAGDLLVLDVNIGTEAFPAIDIHGVSFAVNMVSTFVDSATVEVVYLESGFLVKDAPYIDLMYQPVDGVIHTAGTKTNALGSTGSGIIATLSFIVEETAEGIKVTKRSASNTNGDIVTTIEVTDIIIEDSRGFKYALPNNSLDITVKSGEGKNQATSQNLIISPNPSHDIVNIACEDGSIFNSLNIYSIDGRLIKSVNQINSNEATIQINDIKDGLYIIKASSENNVYSSKLIKK